MSADAPRIVPLGDNAVIVEFGREISVELNERSIALANYLDANPFAGYVESVPAYSSTAVFYDVGEVDRTSPSAATTFEKVKGIIEPILSRLDGTAKVKTRSIEIPVSFNDESALDLAFVAKNAGLNADEVIGIFISAQYRVFMVGFLPGFAYMGEVDPRIATPRKKTPRLRIPAGSVGIAGRQTGIYPFESPGGWQIVGRTKIEMFRPDSDPPCFLLPGDVVKFIPI